MQPEEKATDWGIAGHLNSLQQNRKVPKLVLKSAQLYLIENK
jgi:hypothetical protein